MRRKFLAFSLALATALSTGICMPQVLAAEKQNVNEAVDMEADTKIKMPIIKDDTGTITEEMKARLIAKFVKEFTDEDLSDFTVEYSSNDNSNFDNPSGNYRFNVFYKVYIPKSVTEIGEGVFERCDALTEVYYEGSEAEWNELVSKSNLNVKADVSYNSYSTEQKLPGDVNLDGEVNVSDVVMLQKWLVKSGDLTCWQNADLCGDGIINVFDCVMLKRKVMKNMQSYPVENPEVIDEFTPCTATLEDDFSSLMIEVTIKHQYSVPDRVWTADDFKGVSNIKSVNR
ncbi:MAG: dockerin type I repeat-containing protein [Clostridium sp.]|nr:dockerin type I repeat-containing protein [Clostridium sp.]